MNFDKERGDIFTQRYIDNLKLVKLIVPVAIARIGKELARKDGKPKIYQEGIIRKFFSSLGEEYDQRITTKVFYSSFYVTWELKQYQLMNGLSQYGFNNLGDGHLKYNLVTLQISEVKDEEDRINIDKISESLRANQREIELYLTTAMRAKEDIENLYKRISSIKSELRDLRDILSPPLQAAYFEDSSILNRLY